MQRAACAGDGAQEMQAADEEEDGVWLEAVPAAVLGRIRVQYMLTADMLPPVCAAARHASM